MATTPVSESPLPPLVLLLGGSGFIGVHLMLELHGRFQVAIVDLKLPRAEAIIHAENSARGLPILAWQFDLLRTDFAHYPQMPRVPHCAIMLAALKDVSEGEQIPHQYIRTNVALCVNSVKYLAELGVKRLIQASSAAIYHTSTNDSGKRRELVENCEYGTPIGIYGYSKYITEFMACRLASPDQQVVVLRYMNPIGSRPELDLFADIGICTTLMAQSNGKPYENRGNAIRDYIHITDLAKFHSHLLEIWDDRLFPGVADSTRRGYAPEIFNVGSGVETSVAEVIDTFGRVSGFPAKDWVLAPLPQHEGYNTAGSMTKVALMMPHWWWSTPRISLETALKDYRRLFIRRVQGPPGKAPEVASPCHSHPPSSSAPSSLSVARQS